MLLVPQDLFVDITTRNNITSVDAGRRYFELLDEHAPRWYPGKYGFSEPMRTPFSVETLHEAWKPKLLWKTKQGGVAWGAVDMPVAAHQRHSDIFINAVHHESDSLTVPALMRSVGEAFAPDYGYAHLLTVEEIREYSRPEVAQWSDGPFMSVPLHLLQESLPDLYWANLLGPPYVELFGAERIASTPAHLVVEVAPDVFYLQLTSDVEDVYDLAGFNNHRSLAKEHLGVDAFWRADASLDDYERPDFRLPQPSVRTTTQTRKSNEHVQRILNACSDLSVPSALVDKTLEYADDSLAPEEPFSPFALVCYSDGETEFFAGMGELADMDADTLAELARSAASRAADAKDAAFVTCTASPSGSTEAEMDAELQVRIVAGGAECELTIVVRRLTQGTLHVETVRRVNA